MQGDEREQLLQLIEKHGLRGVLTVMAEICEEHHDKALPLPLLPDMAIEEEDLLTAAANLRGDLF